MRTSIAAEYTAGSKWTILRAVEAGLLKPAGRCGRSFTFTKASLDAYMVGEPVSESAPAASPRRASISTSADALARIADIAKGRP
jgi:hypothetical protein